MTRSKWVRRALASAAVFAATGALADTGTLAVSATISPTCKLTSVPPMSFSLNPVTTANGTANSVVTYRCTKGTAPAGFTVGGGASPYASGTSPLKGTGTNTDTLPFSITWTNPTTAGTGLGTDQTPQQVTLSGTILNADFVNAAADTYSTNVAVVITP